MAKIPIFIVLLAFVTNTLGIFPSCAQEYHLPAPGVMVHLSPPLDPPILKGIKVHPDNPFKFEFILDKGDSMLSNDGLKDESKKLIKYFLASLTIPEKDLWVNLSPYEKDRIIPNSFGLTEMGRDLLAEDYMLKQITASLIYPEDEVGRKFWKRIYEEAAKKFGTTNVPVNTYNKVWIVPEKAVVYENEKAGTAYVVESKLKVMLEQDYLSLEKHMNDNSLPLVGRVREGDIKVNSPPPDLPHEGGGINALGSQIVREVVIPELTKEVNDDKNFSKLRQIYNSLILAIWYKKKIKDSILSQVYADKNKVAGVRYASTVIPAKAGNHFRNDVDGLYQEYLKAFKKGVYNYIKDEIDPVTKETVPKKYFSGGISGTDLAMKVFQVASNLDSSELTHAENDVIVGSQIDPAMNTPLESDKASVLKNESDRAEAVPVGQVRERVMPLYPNWFTLNDVKASQPHFFSDETAQAVFRIIAAPNGEFDRGREFGSEMTHAIIGANPYKYWHRTILFQILIARMKAAYLKYYTDSYEKELLDTLIRNEVRYEGKLETRPITGSTNENRYREFYIKAKERIFDDEVEEKYISREEDTSKYGRNHNLSVLAWERTYPIGASGKEFIQRVTFNEEGNVIHFYHARGDLIPAIMALLDDLWDQIIDTKDVETRYEALARYEWWLVQANPFYRAAASIEDAMSIIAQLATGIPLRNEYAHQDFDILSLPLERYVVFRVAQLKDQAIRSGLSKIKQTGRNVTISQDRAMIDVFHKNESNGVEINDGHKKFFISKEYLDKIVERTRIARNLNVELSTTLYLKDGVVVGMQPEDEKESNIIVFTPLARDEIGVLENYEYYYDVLFYFRPIVQLAAQISGLGHEASIENERTRLKADFGRKLRSFFEKQSKNVSVQIYSLKQMKRYTLTEENQPSLDDLINDLSNAHTMATTWFTSFLIGSEKRPDSEYETITIHNHANENPGPPSGLDLSGGFFNGNVSGIILHTYRGDELFFFHQLDASNKAKFEALYNLYWYRNGDPKQEPANRWDDQNRTFSRSINEEKVLEELRKLSMGTVFLDRAMKVAGAITFDHYKDKRFLGGRKNGLRPSNYTLPTSTAIYPMAADDIDPIKAAFIDFPELRTFVLIDNHYRLLEGETERSFVSPRFWLIKKLQEHGFNMDERNREVLSQERVDQNGRLEVEATVDFESPARGQKVRFILYSRNYLDEDFVPEELVGEKFGLTIIKYPGWYGIPRVDPKSPALIGEFYDKAFQGAAANGLIYVTDAPEPPSSLNTQHNLKVLYEVKTKSLPLRPDAEGESRKDFILYLKDRAMKSDNGMVGKILFDFPHEQKGLRKDRMEEEWFYDKFARGKPGFWRLAGRYGIYGLIKHDIVGPDGNPLGEMYGLGPQCFIALHKMDIFHPSEALARQYVDEYIQQFGLSQEEMSKITFISPVSEIEGAPFNPYTASTSAVMIHHQNQISENVVLDLGSGSATLSLLALKLGAKKAILVENNPIQIAVARALLEAQGYKEGVHFMVIDKNLDQKEEIIAEIKSYLTDEELRKMVAMGNIGSWPIYGKANQYAVEIAAQLKMALFINGGYKIGAQDNEPISSLARMTELLAQNGWGVQIYLLGNPLYPPVYKGVLVSQPVADHPGGEEVKGLAARVQENIVDLFGDWAMNSHSAIEVKYLEKYIDSRAVDAKAQAERFYLLLNDENRINQIRIRVEHILNGHYEDTEKAIRQALKENDIDAFSIPRDFLLYPDTTPVFRAGKGFNRWAVGTYGLLAVNNAYRHNERGVPVFATTLGELRHKGNIKPDEIAQISDAIEFNLKENETPPRSVVIVNAREGALDYDELLKRAQDFISSDMSMNVAARGNNVGDRAMLTKEELNQLEMLKGKMIPEDGAAQYSQDSKKQYKIMQGLNSLDPILHGKAVKELIRVVNTIPLEEGRFSPETLSRASYSDIFHIVWIPREEFYSKYNQKLGGFVHGSFAFVPVSESLLAAIHESRHVESMMKGSVIDEVDAYMGSLTELIELASLGFVPAIKEMEELAVPNPESDREKRLAERFPDDLTKRAIVLEADRTRSKLLKPYYLLQRQYAEIPDYDLHNDITMITILMLDDPLAYKRLGIRAKFLNNEIGQYIGNLNRENEVTLEGDDAPELRKILHQRYYEYDRIHPRNRQNVEQELMRILYANIATYYDVFIKTGKRNRRDMEAFQEFMQLALGSGKRRIIDSIKDNKVKESTEHLMSFAVVIATWLSSSSSDVEMYLIYFLQADSIRNVLGAIDWETLSMAGVRLKQKEHQILESRFLQFKIKYESDTAQLSKGDQAMKVADIENPPGWDLNNVSVESMDHDFFEWVNSGGMDDRDKRILEEILTGDKTLLGNMLSTLGGKVAIKDEDDIDGKNGRTVYLKLTKPFVSSSGIIPILRIKGGRLEENEDGMIRSHNGRGKVTSSMRVNKEGDIVSAPGILDVQGGMSDYQIEYKLMREGQKGLGFETDYPVASGIWKGKIHEGRQAGFVIAGMRSDDVRIFKSLYPDALKDIVTGQGKAISFDDSKIIFEKIGQSLRAYHEAGYFHMYFHPMNIGVEIDANHNIRIILRDLDATKMRSDLLGDVVRQEAAYRLIDIQRLIGRMSGNGGPDFDYPETIRNLEPLVYAFWKGYLKHEAVENQLIGLIIEASQKNFLLLPQWVEDYHIYRPAEYKHVYGMVWRVLYNLAISRSLADRGNLAQIAKNQNTAGAGLEHLAMNNAGSRNGGIDLSKAKDVLQTQNSGVGIKFHIDPAQLAQYENAPGFTVGSITIQPLKSLSVFLGLNDPQASVKSNIHAGG